MSYFPRDHKDRPQFAISGPFSAYRSLLVTGTQPEVALSAIYGIRDDDTETFAALGGTATIYDTATGREFQCTSGNTNSFGYGVIRSKRAISFRPGVGKYIVVGARFGTPQTLTGMRVGGFTSGNEVSFGYDGTTFGILKKSGGVLEMRKLTITTTPGATQTATLILNGSTFTAQFDTAGTTTLAAVDMAENSFTGWSLFSNGNTVLFQNQALGANAGEFSFTTTGDAVATFSTVITGAAATETWIYQSSWNRDRMDGSKNTTYNRSKHTLDPQKGNIYTIVHKSIGFGTIEYWIDDPQADEKILVHVDEEPNSSTIPPISIPILKVGWFAFNNGAANNVTIYGDGAMGAIQSLNGDHPTRNPRGLSNSKNIGTTFTPVISFRVRREFDGVINLREIGLQELFVSCDGTKVSQARLVIGGTLTNPIWTYIDEAESIVEYDTSATAITSPRIVLPISLGKTDSIAQVLSNLNIKIIPSQTVSILCRTTGATSDFSGSLVWQE